jgi:tetratricopeptide (TPR) repeat protein
VCAALTLLSARAAAVERWGGEVAREPGAVLLLPEAIQQVARVLSPDVEDGYSFLVGCVDPRSPLEAYEAHMLAFRLRQAGSEAEVFPAGAVPESRRFPTSLNDRLHGELRDAGSERFVTVAATTDEGQRHLEVAAYDVVTGHLRRSVSLPVSLPDYLAELVLARPARLAAADRLWLELFDALLAGTPVPNALPDAPAQVAEAAFFFDSGLWTQAAAGLEAVYAGRPSAGFARALMARQLAGEPSQAAALAEGVLRQYPDSGPVWALRSWLSLRQGRAEDAIMYLAEARLWGMAREGLYRYARGLIALEQDDTDVAGAELEGAAELVPDAHFTQVQLARFYRDRADLDRAIDAYRRATGTAGADERTWGELAVALEAAGRADEALEALRSGFAIDSGNIVVTRHLAALLKRQGQHEEAVELLRLAAEANPRNPNLIAAHGDASADVWKLDDAAAAFAEAAAVADRFTYGTVRLARVHRMRYEYAEARRLLRDLLAVEPEDAPARLEMARLLAEIGHTEQALDVLEPVAALPDREVDARLAMADVHLAADRPAEAVAAAQIAAAARHDAATYAALTRALLAAGDAATAENAGAAAVQRDPMSPEAHVAAGAAQLARGLVDEAAKSAERACTLDPYHVPALELAGDVESARGEFQRCSEFWQRALKLNPWSAQMHKKLSDVLAEELNDRWGSRRHHDRYLELKALRAEAGL